jgi:hypothetical protein
MHKEFRTILCPTNSSPHSFVDFDSSAIPKETVLLSLYNPSLECIGRAFITNLFLESVFGGIERQDSLHLAHSDCGEDLRGALAFDDCMR